MKNSLKLRNVDTDAYFGMVELRQRNKLKSNHFFGDQSHELKSIVEAREPKRLQQLTEWFQRFIDEDLEPEVLFPIKNQIHK